MTPLINAALLNLKLYLRRVFTAHGWPTPYWGLLKENIFCTCFDAGYYDEYKRYRNYLCGTIKTAKRLYFKNRFDQLKADSKSMWRVINEAIRPNSSKDNSFKSALLSVTQKLPKLLMNISPFLHLICLATFHPVILILSV